MAVYTDVTAEDLGRFLAGYDIGELLAYKGIAEGVENSNFLVHTDRGNFILTLYEKRVAKSDLPFFLGLMTELIIPAVGPVVLLPEFVSTLPDLFFCWLFHFRCFRIVGIGDGRSVQALHLLSNPNV